MVKLNTKKVGTLSEDDMEQKMAESSDMIAKQRLIEEGNKIARKLKKSQMKEIADETGNDFSTIEKLHKRLKDDPSSIIKELVETQHTNEMQKKKVGELEEWFMSEVEKNSNLKIENEILREKLESIRIQSEISTLTMNLEEWTTEDRLST